MTYIPAALRRFVFTRAEGRCEYCLIAEDRFFSPYQIDHIISEKHMGRTVEGNLALCCPLCNKYKGSDLTTIDEETDEIVQLYNPRVDDWSEHFRLERGVIVGLSKKGRGTVRMLRLNLPIRVQQRIAT